VDSSLITLLLKGAGVTSVVVIILLLLKVLVPGWVYRKVEEDYEKLEKANDDLREALKDSARELALTNQLAWELRIAAARQGGLPQLGGEGRAPPGVV
jgi:Tfp pilus assembly protein PilO